MASDLTKQEVKKHVSAIHSVSDLSLLERKLINVFLLNAYDKLLTETVHSIPVPILCKLLGWNESNNSTLLKKAIQRLQTTIIEYNAFNDSKETWKSMQALGTAGLADGICTYTYPHGLPEKLANPDIYATINIGIQNRFAGSYSFALYENCLRFKSVGSTGFKPVDLWRNILGAKDQHYDEFKRFNSKVLTKAIAEINAVSDILVTPEFRRENRRVTEIRFKVEDNPQQSLFSAKANDEYDELRKSPAYKRLMSHRIGDKLAVTWILQEGEDKIMQYVDVVESRDKRGLVRSPSGLLSHLVTNKADVSESEYSKKKKAATSQSAEIERVEKANRARVDEESRQVDQVIKALSIERKQELTRQYFASEGSGREHFYNEQTAAFKRGEPSIHFQAWLRSVIRKEMDLPVFTA